MSEPLILGIESSYDETGVDIVHGNQLLTNEVANSVDLHARFGGVVPEVASRVHLSALVPALQRAVAAADVDPAEVDAIVVTAGPGLIGTLLVGISAAKALAAHLGKPLYGVSRLVERIAVDLPDHGPLPIPALVLLVSGGHTLLLHVRDLIRDIEGLGPITDDTAGEAYDKVARLLDLPYPGGPAIDHTAADNDPATTRFPRGLTARHGPKKHRFNFSFSGLKTAVARWVEAAWLEGREVPVGDVCASFQEIVADVLVVKALNAARQVNVGMILLGGEVATNSWLRGLLEEWATAEDVTARRPRPGLCTDNGVMVAAAGLTAMHARLSPSLLDFSALTRPPVNQIVIWRELPHIR